MKCNLCGGNSIHFRHTNGCSCESVKVFETEKSRPEENSNPQHSDSCQMFLPFELSGPDVCCTMILSTGSGGIDIWSKVKFEILAVQGQPHSFSTHERVFLWKCQNFRDRKCLDLRGTQTPTFGFMLNALAMYICLYMFIYICVCVSWHYHAWPWIRLFACPRHKSRAT